MTRDGRTGVVIAVPEAEPLLTRVSRRHSGAVREGVPAHISLLYPFLDLEFVDDNVLGELRAVFEDQPRMSVTLDACHNHGDFVFLSPNPDAELAALTRRLRQRWPDVVPYEGRYDAPEPHVTVATGVSDGSAEEIRREVFAALPIRTEPGEAWLVAFDGRWGIRERFGFEG